MPDTWMLGAAAICLGVASVTIWFAALMPQFFPVWNGSDAFGAVERHSTLWQWNVVLFLVSAVTTLCGIALVFPAGSSALALPTLLMLAVATALWAASNALRISAGTAVPRHRTPGGEAWLALAQSWAVAMWHIAGAMLVAVFASVGAMVLTTGILAAWSGWVTLGAVVLSTGMFIRLRDLPPVVAYLPVPPLAVAAAIAALQQAS